MLNQNNCLEFLVVAHMCNLSDLESASLETVGKNKSAIRISEEWKELKKDYPSLAMKVCEKVME
jgi:hypothetical protein